MFARGFGCILSNQPSLYTFRTSTPLGVGFFGKFLEHNKLGEPQR